MAMATAVQEAQGPHVWHPPTQPQAHWLPPDIAQQRPSVQQTMFRQSGEAQYSLGVCPVPGLNQPATCAREPPGMVQCGHAQASRHLEPQQQQQPPLSTQEVWRCASLQVAGQPPQAHAAGPIANPPQSTAGPSWQPHAIAMQAAMQPAQDQAWQPQVAVQPWQPTKQWQHEASEPAAHYNEPRHLSGMADAQPAWQHQQHGHVAIARGMCEGPVQGVQVAAAAPPPLPTAAAGNPELRLLALQTQLQPRLQPQLHARHAWQQPRHDGGHTAPLSLPNAMSSTPHTGQCCSHDTGAAVSALHTGSSSSGSLQPQVLDCGQRALPQPQAALHAVCTLQAPAISSGQHGHVGSAAVLTHSAAHTCIMGGNTPGAHHLLPAATGPGMLPQVWVPPPQPSSMQQWQPPQRQQQQPWQPHSQVFYQPRQPQSDAAASTNPGIGTGAQGCHVVANQPVSKQGPKPQQGSLHRQHTASTGSSLLAPMLQTATAHCPLSMAAAPSAALGKSHEPRQAQLGNTFTGLGLTYPGSSSLGPPHETSCTGLMEHNVFTNQQAATPVLGLFVQQPADSLPSESHVHVHALQGGPVLDPAIAGPHKGVPEVIPKPAEQQAWLRQAVAKSACIQAPVTLHGAGSSCQTGVGGAEAAAGIPAAATTMTTDTNNNTTSSSRRKLPASFGGSAPATKALPLSAKPGSLQRPMQGAVPAAASLCISQHVPPCKDDSLSSGAVSRKRSAEAEVVAGRGTAEIMGLRSGGQDHSLAALPALQTVLAAQRQTAGKAVQLPLLDFKGIIRYAATPMEVDWLCGQALASKPLCMGLDMEWRPQYRAGARQHPVALVQVCYAPSTRATTAYAKGIGATPTSSRASHPPAQAGASATPSGTSGCVSPCQGGSSGASGMSSGRAGSCGSVSAVAVSAPAWAWDRHGGEGLIVLLLHVCYSGVPAELRKLLACAVPKLGVNIGGDAAKLMRDYQVPISCLVELGAEACSRVLQSSELITCNTEVKRWSLAGLVESVLGCHLPKPVGVRCGNWDKRPLDMCQQRYAALDAYAAVAVHMALQRLPLRPGADAARAAYSQVLQQQAAQEVSHTGQGAQQEFSHAQQGAVQQVEQQQQQQEGDQKEAWQ